MRGLVLLVGFLALAAAAGADEADKGRAIYDLRCAPCHGASGAGDGPVAEALQPRPRNFRTPEFWRDRTDDQIREVVKHGKAGTLMTPFEGVLSATEIDDVVRHLATFRPAAR
jgi:mono/diheme cytochrome c family protein